LEGDHCAVETPRLASKRETGVEVSGDGFGFTEQAAVFEDHANGLAALAMGLSPVGTTGLHDALRYLERDVLDRWKGALEDHDTARVAQLVEIAHAVREALRTEAPGVRGGLV
jgi:hypothetical protein